MWSRFLKRGDTHRTRYSGQFLGVLGLLTRNQASKGDYGMSLEIKGMVGGEGGIRTPVTRKGKLDFEYSARPADGINRLHTV